MIAPFTPIQYFPRDPSQGNKAGKRKRGECIQIEKEEISVFIFEDNISIYVQNIKKTTRASLVAQWLRVCLPMQGTRVRALVWEDPTCRGAAGPVSHSC